MSLKGIFPPAARRDAALGFQFILHHQTTYNLVNKFDISPAARSSAYVALSSEHIPLPQIRIGRLKEPTSPVPTKSRNKRASVYAPWVPAPSARPVQSRRRRRRGRRIPRFRSQLLFLIPHAKRRETTASPPAFYFAVTPWPPCCCFLAVEPTFLRAPLSFLPFGFPISSQPPFIITHCIFPTPTTVPSKTRKCRSRRTPQPGANSVFSR